MFGKMMNRFYYGKSGQGDFSKEDLPQNRWQLFWAMLKVRFAALFRLNLLYMIAWIPAIIVIGRCLMMAYSGLASVAEGGQEQLANFGEFLNSLVMQTLVFLVPAITVTGPATAGVAYVTRNCARDEHAFLWSDFRDAVKANWKQALLTSFITGMVPLLMYVCVQFYGQMAETSWLFMLPQGICIVVGVLWMCSLMYMYPQMVTYQINYRGLVRNSLIMTIGRLPQTVGLKLLSLLPALICAVVCFVTPYIPYALLIYGVYYVLIGFALSRFVGASYSNAVFDRYINPNVEGAEVNRGLYLEDEDEEPEEDTPQE